MAVLLPALAEMVSSHAEKEGGKSAAGGIEALGVANQSHENLLRHILCHSGIPAHVQCKPENCGMSAPVQERKGIFISGNHASEEAVIS